jgi:hypothetical protein
MELLSELVTYRNQILALSMQQGEMAYHADMNKILHYVNDYNVLPKRYKLELDGCVTQVNSSFNKFSQYLQKIQDEIESIIVERGKAYFQESTDRYETSIKNREVQQPAYTGLDRHLPMKIPPEAEEFLRSRLSRYSSWQHPGLIIHPGRESFIDTMVANDPLYLIDDRHELLVPALTTFNDLYRQRLCAYVITETLLDQPILHAIPDNQFGLCFVYKYLHFRPFEVVTKYLNELYQKLKPGGVCVITVNDCDRAPGVKLVEQKWCYYTPLSLVLEYCKKIGYTIEFTWTDGGAGTWVELRKPGELTSVRGGQTMAKIIPK